MARMQQRFRQWFGKRFGQGFGKWAIAATAAIAVSYAAEARAADGVFEINQACVAAGCFPGDAPGFPVSGQNSKSYRLTSNLTVPDGNTTAVVLGDYATLDLGGFSIAGTTVCTGTLVAVCTGGSGTSDGVHAGTGATIRNGAIRRMGTAGIRSGRGTLVEDMLIEENRNRGIAANHASGWVIRNSRILRNGSHGIDLAVAGAYALITGNVIEGNERSGVYGLGLLLLGNSITNNGDEGFALNFAGGRSGFARNVLHYNNGGDAEDQTVGGVQIGLNVCGSNTTCP